MKVGVIDLGSNTSKLLIAQKKAFPDQQNFKTLEEKSLPCRIFTLTEKKVLKIPKEVATRLVRCIDKFQIICQSHQTNHLIIVATEALRKAENSKEITLFLEQQTGLKIKILSGQEEAKAVVKGLQTDPMINDLADYVALDIGGGSLEIMEVEQKRISNIQSLPLGAVTVALTNSSNLNLPLTLETQLKTRGFVRKKIQKVFKNHSAKRPHLVGTGGLLVFVSLILNNPEGYMKNRSLNLSEIKKLAKEVCSLSLSDRVGRFPKLPSDRADVFPFGLITIIETMELLGTQSITHSLHNLRYGIIQEFFESLDAGILPAQ
jgi:exopolyphosphatase / guanosine-5'-triphosphate,3'-diphosphate pyrophosphatase